MSDGSLASPYNGNGADNFDAPMDSIPTNTVILLPERIKLMVANIKCY